MKKLVRVIKFETSNVFKKSTVFTALLLMFIGLIFLQFGADKFGEFQAKRSALIKAEAKKLDTFVSTFRYGIHGLKKIGFPCNVYPLFYNSPFKELYVFIDYEVRLNIFNPQLGENAFAQTQGDNLDFAWYFPLIIGIIVLMWGYFTTRGKQEQFRFYLIFAGEKTVFCGIVLARVIFLIFFFTATFLCLSIQIRYINHIMLSLSNVFGIIIILAIGLFLLSVFLIIGITIGYVKNPFRAAILIFATWFCFTIFIPKIFNIYFSKNAKSIMKSIYQHELQKLSILTEFEKSVYDRIKKAMTMDEKKKLNRESYDSYLKETFTQITDLEKAMVADINKSTKIVHLISILTPCTFYKSVSNELSSFGLNGFVQLYERSIQDYEQFVRYCLENRMSRMRPKDNPFIKNPDDYIIHLKSSLPKYFGAGLVLNFAYILILLLFSYHRFKKVLFPIPENDYKDLDFKFKSGKHFAYSYKNEDFSNQVFNVLTGRTKKFNGKISVDGENIVTDEKKDFTYLPDPDAIPGEIKVNSFINFITGTLKLREPEISKLREELDNKILNKRFEKLERFEKVTLLLKIAKIKKSKIYLIHNLFLYIPNNIYNKVLKKTFEEFKDPDTLIIELISVPPLKHYDIDHYSTIYLQDSTFKEDVLEKSE